MDEHIGEGEVKHKRKNTGRVEFSSFSGRYKFNGRFPLSQALTKSRMQSHRRDTEQLEKYLCSKDVARKVFMWHITRVSIKIDW